MRCDSCGKEIGEAKFCRYCGAVVAKPEGSGDKSTTIEKVDALATDESRGDGNSGSSSSDEEIRSPDSIKSGDPSKKPDSAFIRGVLVALVLVGAIFGVIGYGIETTEHWEKVDDPGHYEEYQTGYYYISMDEVSPCYVGQSWQECTNAYIAEYNRECTKPIYEYQFKNQSDYVRSSVQDTGPIINAAFIKLPLRNQELCQRYSEMIQDMQTKGNAYSYVSSLGSWGRLHSEPAIDKRLIGRKTHDAVCYYGFIGECEKKDEGIEGSGSR